MYRYENPNPSGRSTDDCLVRSLAIIMDVPWEKAYMDLCQRGLIIHDMPNKDSTLSLYMKEKGYKRYLIPEECPVCYSIRDFAREYRHGKYLVLTGNHAVAVMNGDYYDTTDSGEEIPLYYYKKGDTQDERIVL